jgi:hypothetical protein
VKPFHKQQYQELETSPTIYLEQEEREGLRPTPKYLDQLLFPASRQIRHYDCP